jgi:hypothetical protein
VVQGESGITLQVVARGCLDTAPTAFPAGTRVWFISYGSRIVNIRGPVPPTETVNNSLRFQPYNNQSEHLFASCLDSLVVGHHAGPIREGLLPDRCPVQRTELSGIDHRPADRVMVAPE